MEIDEAIAFVEDSFKITGRGIIIALQHNQEGLKRETRLESLATGHIWEVKARIIFDHTENEQKRFDYENIEFMLLSFKTIEDRNKSKTKILLKEASNLYQYLVVPISHDMKPENKERLKITSPNTRL